MPQPWNSGSANPLGTDAGIVEHTYYERLAQGLRQLMAGSRKFSMEYISWNDIAALTRESAEISGIQHIMGVDRAEVEEILGGATRN